MKVHEFELAMVRGKVDSINIISNEGDIYTAQAMIKGLGYTLEQKGSAEPLVFHSYIEAKRSFDRYKQVPLYLQQNDIHDEMVG